MEYMASRSHSAEPPFVCETCAAHDRGYACGLAEALGHALRVRAGGGTLADAIREIESTIHGQDPAEVKLSNALAEVDRLKRELAEVRTRAYGVPQHDQH